MENASNREQTAFALSLKQPWAALVVHGRKTIEVRNWPTLRRGRILIHAARVPDDRVEAWRRVPPELEPATHLRGGIIGAVDLVAVREYRSLQAFLEDEPHHLNDPSWFTGPVLYGFQFVNAIEMPFRRLPGNVRFFAVPEERT